MCCPITFPSKNDEQPANMHYLAAAKDIFVHWQNYGKAGLTSQTFLACIQTMSTVHKLSQYLHKKNKFS